MTEYKEYQDQDDDDVHEREEDEHDAFILSRRELRDIIDELGDDLQTATAKVKALTKQNEQMTMDLILIAATLGVDANMNLVMERIGKLLELDKGTLE